MNTQAGLPILTKKGEAAENLDEDLDAARRRKWAEAEKKLPRRVPTDAENATNTDSDIKANFFEISINPKVKLFTYSITLGEIGRKQSVDSKDRTKPKENDKRKFSKDETIFDHWSTCSECS